MKGGKIMQSFVSRRVASALFSSGLTLLLGCASGDGQSSPASTETALGRVTPGKLHPGEGPPFGRGPWGHRPHGGRPGGGPGSAGASAGGASGSTGSGSAGRGTATGGASTGAGGATAAGAGGAYGDPGVCGDGIWSGYEGCDDGNTQSGDGCSATCQVESGYRCSYPGAPCTEYQCGDGVQDRIYSSANGTGGAGGGSAVLVYSEDCDDGNSNSGDGCSADCAVESGYICDSPGQPCRAYRCGDGYQDWVYAGYGSGGAATGGAGGVGGAGPVLVYSEECDDGNANSGDGCSAECGIEPGYICGWPGQSCHMPQCGDGIQDWIPGTGGVSGTGGASSTAGASSGGAAGGVSYGSFEQCDDGNANSGDGCSADCTVEPGYFCWYPGEACRMPSCGDGYVDPYYPGDFENSGTGGASTGGAANAGAPAGGASTAGAAGGSAVNVRESCDDGNTVAHDGCDADCGIEPNWSCPVPGQACQRAVCGNGIVDWPVEDCDDGNNRPGDGCTHCHYDAGIGGRPSTTGGAGGAAGAGTGNVANSGGAVGRG